MEHAADTRGLPVCIEDPADCSRLDFIEGDASLTVWGSQTELAYSSVGRTRDWYAISLTFFLLPIFKFLLSSPMVLLALLQVLVM